MRISMRDSQMEPQSARLACMRDSRIRVSPARASRVRVSPVIALLVYTLFAQRTLPKILTVVHSQIFCLRPGSNVELYMCRA